LSIRASVTVEADPNILALKRMLVENGMWLVWVDSRRITKAVKVPRGVMVDDLIEAEIVDDESASSRVDVSVSRRGQE